jgi:hypothetical protein
MNNNFLQYNQTNIIDKPFDKPFYHNNYIDCLNGCNKTSNCKGLVISNPLCNKNETLSECINSLNTQDILNIQSENLNEHSCKFLTDINDTNKIYYSENNKSFIKNNDVNLIPQFSENSNKFYYLKINNKYLSINNKFNNIFLIGINDINNACLFQFNSNGNIIETKTSKCLQINGGYIILSNCDSNELMQKFIYENKLNSIRPQKYAFGDLILCLSLNNNNELIDENRILLEECKYTNEQIINYEEIEQEKNINQEKQESIENFIQFKNIEYCSNPIYKPIIFIILVGIIFYFIWFINRKRYFDDSEYIEIDSTPFSK